MSSRPQSVHRAPTNEEGILNDLGTAAGIVTGLPVIGVVPPPEEGPFLAGLVVRGADDEEELTEKRTAAALKRAMHARPRISTTRFGITGDAPELAPLT